MSEKDDDLYAQGMAAGEAEARAEAGDLVMTRVITGKPAIWVSAYRLGRARGPRERHRAREAAEAAGLFAGAHKDCRGRFEFHERLPAATVYACGTCGQHRVTQDDPEAHSAAMAALAEYLTDAAGPA